MATLQQTNIIQTLWLDSPYGWWEMEYSESAIHALSFKGQGASLSDTFPANSPLLSSQNPIAPIGKEAAQRLQTYFQGKPAHFEDLPLAPTGTAFQMRVWQGLKAIKYGETLSYKQLATAIELPAASRAVGGALAKNPLLIFLPCHRVLTSSGQLGGFMGSQKPDGGTALKAALLQLEGVQVPALSVNEHN